MSDYTSPDRPGRNAAVREDDVERAALAWFEALGWRVLHGSYLAPDGPGQPRGDWREVVLRSRLTDALARLNPGLPQSALDQAARQIIADTARDESVAILAHPKGWLGARELGIDDQRAEIFIRCCGADLELAFDLQAEAPLAINGVEINDKIIEWLGVRSLLHRDRADPAGRACSFVVAQQRRQIIGNGGVFISEALAAR